MGKAKYLLIFTAVALIFIGLSYAMAMEQDFKDDTLVNASLIQFIPEECKVLNTSDGVTAGIVFHRDKLGDIVDKNFIQLIASNVYAGANASFSITAQNISDIPLSIDRYTLNVDSTNRSLANLIYFSGSVKIYRDGSEYYDVLGTFKMVRLTELADNLTNIMKYRKIDITEKIVLELNQQFDDDIERFAGKTGLSYQLVPVFIQYFPKNDDSLNAVNDENEGLDQEVEE